MLCRRAGGDGDPGAQCTGDLDGVAAHAAGTAVHQQQLALVKVTGHRQVGPHRARHLRHACGVHQVEADRMRQELAGRNHHVFGVATTRQQGANLLSRRPIRDVVSHRFDDAGGFHAEHVAGARRRGIEPGGLQQVGPVDPGRADFDQHFTVAGGDIGDLLPEESISGFGDDGIHGGHATSCRFLSVRKAMGRIA